MQKNQLRFCHQINEKQNREKKENRTFSLLLERKQSRSVEIIYNKVTLFLT